ncbi:MAG: hypothetical protein H6827_09700 [Planctomycetes bacterium]|nr:hypothetical protein [Planctomycetota bacterium]
MESTKDPIQPISVGDLLRVDDRIRVVNEGKPFWLDVPPDFVGMTVVRQGAAFRRFGGCRP